MLLLSNRIFRFTISVYEGISPELLATMSLGQGIQGSTHLQLINSLKKNNIIQTQSVLQALKEIDRQLFTQEKHPYQNKPYSISGKQKMTDILTHSIILQQISPYLALPSARIIDIGTGHGYLAFTIAKIIELSGAINNQIIKGIDINQECIRKCEMISHKIPLAHSLKQKMIFERGEIQQILNKGDPYDVIIGGFYIQSQLSRELEQMISDKGVGIWATEGKRGQILCRFYKNKKPQQIMTTLFSNRVVKSKYSQYFLEGHEIEAEQKDGDRADQKKVEQVMRERAIAQKKKEKEQVQKKLKQLLTEYRKEKGKYPSLDQMKGIPQMNEVLGIMNPKNRKF